MKKDEIQEIGFLRENLVLDAFSFLYTDNL